MDLFDNILYSGLMPGNSNQESLTNEQGVMRVKRNGHRKSLSVSYMPSMGNQNAQNYHGSIKHRRNPSLQMSPHSANPPSPVGNITNTINQPVQHKRYHSNGELSVSSALQSQFNFPQSSTITGNNDWNQQMIQNHNPSFFGYQSNSGHQKSISGASTMFTDFVELNLMQQETSQQQNINQGRKLHPLMQHSHFENSNIGDLNQNQLVTNGYPSNISDSEQQNMMSFVEQSESNENSAMDTSSQTLLREIFEQKITKCSWETCNLEMGTQDDLVAHILKDHIGTGKTSYVCEWQGCSRMKRPFTKRHKIQNHVRIHTGERPFHCPVVECGKRFSRQDGLNTHIKTHSSIKPFVCSFPSCHKAYFHSRSLKKHERAHLEATTSLTELIQPLTELDSSQFVLNSDFRDQYIKSSEITSVSNQESLVYDYTQPQFPQEPYSQQTFNHNFSNERYNQGEFLNQNQNPSGYLMQLASLTSLENSEPLKSTEY